MWTQVYTPVLGNILLSALVAAILALIGNTAPVAYGVLGIPIITLASVMGLNDMAISQMVGRQLPIFSFIIPIFFTAPLLARCSGHRQ